MSPSTIDAAAREVVRGRASEPEAFRALCHALCAERGVHILTNRDREWLRAELALALVGSRELAVTP